MSKTTVAVPAPVAFSERGILPRLAGHLGLRQRIRPGLHGGTGCSDGLVKTLPRNAKTSVLDISCHATDTKNPLRITESAIFQ